MLLELLAALAALAATPDAAPNAAIPAPDLSARLATLAGRSRLGVTAIHVETGRVAALRGEERFAMASTFKLPVALAVLRAVEKGTLAEGTLVTLGPGDVRHGIGKQLGAGTYPVSRLLAAMLEESDNTATDALLRLLGGPPVVRAALAEAGVSGIDVSRSELRIHADWWGVEIPADERLSPAALDRLKRNVPAAKAAAAHRAFRKDDRDTATPEAMAALLVKLQRGMLLSPPRTAQLLGWMRACKTGDMRIRAGLPKGTDVADKTGTMDDATNDVALVTLPDGTHLALVVFVDGGAAREKVIASVARAAWEGFAPDGGPGSGAR